jgi:hypothetical protein
MRLRYLDVSQTWVTEQGVEALRRALPGLKEVTLKSSRSRRRTDPPRRDEIFEEILVQALVPTRTEAPNTWRTQGTIIKVYLGSPRLRRQTFRALFPDGFENGAFTSLGSARLADHALVITHLEQQADGELAMVVERNRWPAWLGPGFWPIAPMGFEEPDYRRRQEEAEFLGRVAEQPKSQRVAYLQRQVVPGDDAVAAKAVQLLLMKPFDKTEPHLLKLVKNEHVPLLRRMLIDQGFWNNRDLPWVNSPERLALLESWSRDITSSAEAERLARNLAPFGQLDSETWASDSRSRNRVDDLTAVVRAIHQSPHTSPQAKVACIPALRVLSRGVGRRQGLDLLLQLAIDNSHEDVIVFIVFTFEDYLPLSEEEAKQARRQLERCDRPLRERFEEKFATPSHP